MGILTMSQYEEPTDAVLAALNEWQMASWAAMDAAIDEANETPEWAEGTSPAVERWRNVVNSARQILASMHGQVGEANTLSQRAAISPGYAAMSIWHLAIRERRPESLSRNVVVLRYREHVPDLAPDPVYSCPIHKIRRAALPPHGSSAACSLT